MKHLILPGMAALMLTGAAPALAAGSTGTTGTAPGGTAVAPPPAPGTTGGAGVTAPPAPPSTSAHPTVPGYTAKVVDGVAYAPSMAPIQVKKAIWAGNQIRKKPYIWGGGHQAFKASGYDCSGSVSYVLHAAGLLKTPFDSSDFMSWGLKGFGTWITVYTNPSHAFVQIAGIRLDTSAEADPNPPTGTGPRWRPLFVHPAGFMARHPTGY